MKIQFNTDHNITGSNEYNTRITSLLTKELGRFESYISRLEVHLSDENGAKIGLNDKRCLLEARLKGKQPISVVNQANNHEQAVSGAIDKLKTTLDTIIGRSRNH